MRRKKKQINNLEFAVEVYSKVRPFVEAAVDREKYFPGVTCSGSLFAQVLSEVTIVVEAKKTWKWWRNVWIGEDFQICINSKKCNRSVGWLVSLIAFKHVCLADSTTWHSLGCTEPAVSKKYSAPKIIAEKARKLAEFYLAR